MENPTRYSELNKCIEKYGPEIIAVIGNDGLETHTGYAEVIYSINSEMSTNYIRYLDFIAKGYQKGGKDVLKALEERFPRIKSVAESVAAGNFKPTEYVLTLGPSHAP